MSDLLAIAGVPIFDGQAWHKDAALLIEFGMVSAIVPSGDVPARAERVHLDGGSIVPGFVDLQVNGGGGVLFNNDPSVGAIRTICAAHARFGTTALLPTLITDTVAVNIAAIAAGHAAAQQAVPGFLGLHLEGPHLSLARKGTHDPALIRPMDDSDLARLVAAATDLPNLLLTVAAETVTPQQITTLARAGITVSLGHSDASFADASAAYAAGASMATHLFNAMSQLGNREPGMVGALLRTPGAHAGLIADGIHVHPAAIELALRAKTGPGHIFLVTDAMSQTGTELTELTLNGRTITRANGALRLADGTLAGADLDMIDAVEFMHTRIGLPFEEALRMASLYPARALGVEGDHGHLSPGAIANFVHLSHSRKVQATWIAGTEAYRA
ncbi:N-acetylglucosamine-6-phosphate deacetylase [Devosia neptuniae]|jgi:N-acetylglucosamine-6-phosphate deacetylase|uniref:N-acetylglucosamine-6-phosphate deacetylase n=1 Tax=Devosia TaxID=46913 RepID=UPI0022AFBD6E|nr:N-acetylglucosamine-6-phosphate deacetylase [Devosia neptuniae]MCZ4346113.1 N-acetylglucosamine-6-phosphate deacetylase [Devosia neptuniae]|tara:strand:+ start:7939 stop:9099 length:1161 start_codon:yes stop_codon:yes gene_type:complete